MREAPKEMWAFFCHVRVGTKRQITKRPKTKRPTQQNAQCIKTPNSTKRPITKRPMLQNAQCNQRPTIQK